MTAVPGGEYDRWDLMVRAGTLGAACVRIAIEDHGAHGHVALYRVWPRLRGSFWLASVLASVGGALLLHQNLVAGGIGLALAAIVLAEALQQSGRSVGAVLECLDEPLPTPAPLSAPAPARTPVVVTLAAPDRLPVEGAVAP